MSTGSKVYKESKVKFGLNLAKLRKNKKLSQLDLANLVDVEKTTISRIENGRTNVTLKTMVRLATALEVSVKKLITF